MNLSQKLKDQGWYLTEDGIKNLITATSSEDVRTIIDAALNSDFREIAGGALPNIKREDASITGRIVLQVQRVRNISAPKSNQESKAAPRFLQVDLSDGQTSLQALELEPVPSLSLNIAPGTKIFFRAEKLELMQGYLILRASELNVLGGRVEALYEKWDVARTMQKYARSGQRMSGGSSGPPPWIPFGKKLDAIKEANDKNFKSLAVAGEKDKDGKDNNEFNAMRNEAIASASKSGSKKVFGGGGQNLLDHNVKKILDKGYSEEEAKETLRATNNNLERALYNLKRRNEKKTSGIEPIRPDRGNGSKAGVGGRGGRGGAIGKDDHDVAKPAGNVSLFDFLTNKFPDTEKTASPATNTNTNTFTSNIKKSNETVHRFDKSQSANDRSRFENNISSSFAANRSTGPPLRENGKGRGGNRPEMELYNANARKNNERQQDNSYHRSNGDRTRSGHDDLQNSEQSKPEVRGGGGGRGERGGRRGGGGDRNGGSERSGHASRTAREGNFDARRGNERQSNRFNQPSQPAVTENANIVNSNKRGGANSGSVSNRSSASATNLNLNAKTNKEDYNARVNSLSESTANMKIDTRNDRRRGQNYQQTQQQQHNQPRGQHRQQYQQQQQNPQQQHHQQQQPQQYQSQQQQNVAPIASTSSGSNFNQLSNGYSYDPNKIIGFQSKETNEFAMSLLKSQGVSIATQRQQPQQLPPSQPPSQTQKSPPQAPTMSNFQQQNAKKYLLPNPPAAAASPQAPPPPPQQFGMVQGDGWQWKVGDLCLAKYWDDGRYYEAEITAISEKTCVVFFLGYGNHEEVLKSDCLPITDGNHRPINNMQQHHGQPNLYTNQHAVGGGGGGPQRYRGERQMYVPPQQRRDN